MDALPLAKAGHHVTVLYQSRRWLDEAERRAALGGVQIRVIEGDLTSPPALEVFDLVLCHFVLQYRPDGRADLATLADYIRPGGSLLRLELALCDQEPYRARRRDASTHCHQTLTAEGKHGSARISRTPQTR